jgi:SAM-dependent methyltransferase
VRATDLAAEELVEFIAQFVPDSGRRLLEVGCGRGELAAALAAAGYTVTAIDRDPDAVAATQARGVSAREADFLRFTDDPFDLIVFSRALHELQDADRALVRVDAMLTQGGVLVVDEFARDNADRATAEFFYDVCNLLASAGVLTSPTGPEDQDPLDRWESEYGKKRENPRLGAGEITERVRRQFDVIVMEYCPYLYRHIGQWLTDQGPGPTVLTRLHDIEERRIARGELRQMGMRLSARKKSK